VAEQQTQIDLQATLQHVNIPSFVVDATGVITWINDAATRSFGELTGQPYSVVVVPEDLRIAAKQLRRKLRGAASTDYEIGVVLRDGKRQRAEISSVPIEGGSQCQGFFGVVVTHRPVTVGGRHPKLTPRQSEVLHLLDAGASTEQIATALFLSKETVRNHVRRIFRALGAHSRLEAVAIARGRGLLGT
jgi:PAS domain S-box-containing protein